MDFWEEWEGSEVQALVERYHELTGFWQGYHWECFGGMEDFKEYLRKKIAEKEKELEERQKHDE